MDASFLQRPSKRFDRLLAKIAHWRYGVLAALVLAIVVGELFEHRGFSILHDYFLLTDLTIIGAIMLVIAVLIESLLRTSQSKSRALNILQAKHTLSQRLDQAHEWSDLAEQLCDFLTTLIPKGTIALLITNQTSRRMEVYGRRQPNQAPASSAGQLEAAPLCQTCFAKQENVYRLREVCTASRVLLTENGLAGYCLPISFGTSQKALLQLCAPPGYELSAEQVEILKHIRSDIAVALTITQQRQELANKLVYSTADATRREISRDLHDTLGQNLSFLRLKLEQLARESCPADMAEAWPELARMQAIASESLELLRAKFIIVQPHSQLETSLQQHATLVSERAQVDLQFASSGTPHPVAESTLRQLIYIFREALNNVEKHAGAAHVIINLNWRNNSLTIKVQDNGRGFDPANIQPNAHYGLKIMQERAEAIGGSILIESAPGQGTLVAITLPLIA